MSESAVDEKAFSSACISSQWNSPEFVQELRTFVQAYEAAKVPERESGWQPIATAPKAPGIFLLGYNDKWNTPQIIYCCIATNYPDKPPIWSTFGNTWSTVGQPTHWMPLPNPPETMS